MQRNNAVAQEFGMDAQVFFSRETCQDGVGQGTVSHLNRVPVPYQPGRRSRRSVPRFPRVGAISRQADQRLIVGNDEIHVAYVDESVAMDAGHVPRSPGR